MRTHRLLGMSVLVVGVAILVAAAVLYTEVISAASSAGGELSAYADFMVESVVVPLRRGWSDLTGGASPGPAQFAAAVRSFSFFMGFVGLLTVGVSAWLITRSRGSGDSGGGAGRM